MDRDTKINELDITDEFSIIRSNTTGEEVATELKKLGDDGVALISEQDDIIGFISQHEIIDLVSSGRNPVGLPANKIMSNDYVELLEDETLGNVIPIIAGRYPNAIVVIDGERKCVGFFSRNDYKEVMATLGVYDDSQKPQTPDDWRTKGIALSSMGNTEEAIKCYEKSIETQPNKEKAWNKLAKSLEGINKVKDAIMCYDKVVSINKDNDEALTKKGELHSQQKTQNLAIQCYSLALSVNPNNVKTLINLGMEYSNIGNVEEAIKYFNRAEGVNGETAEIWYRKAGAYSHDKQHAEAIRCYDKAIEADRYFEDAWFDKAVVLDKMGNDKEAYKCFKEIVAINPNNEHAKLALRSYDKTGKFFL